MSLQNEIVAASNQDELEKVLSVFNLTCKKANMQRALALQDLQDMVIEQARKRLETNADEFSNSDLLNYMNSISNTLSKIESAGGDTNKLPTIAIQNNTVYQLDRSSQERVREYLREVMSENGIIVEERTGE